MTATTSLGEAIERDRALARWLLRISIAWAVLWTGIIVVLLLYGDPLSSFFV